MLQNGITLALCTLALCTFILPSAADAALVTYFNFNNYTVAGDGNSFDNSSTGAGGGGTLSTMTLEVAVPNPPPTTYNPWPTSELSATAGTPLNDVAGDGAGTALGLGTEPDGSRLTLGFSSLGFKDLMLSFAAHAPGSNYDDISVSYSLNGTDFIDTGLSMAPSINSYGTSSFNLSSLNGQLANIGSAYLRLTFSGANPNANTFLSIDNLRIDGTGVPEPSQLAMLAMTLLLFGGVAYRRRQRLAGEQPSPGQLLAG